MEKEHIKIKKINSNVYKWLFYIISIFSLCNFLYIIYQDELIKFYKKIEFVDDKKYFDHHKNFDYVAVHGVWKCNKEKALPNQVDILCYKYEKKCHSREIHIINSVISRFIKSDCNDYVIKKWDDMHLIAVNDSSWCKTHILNIDFITEKVELVTKPKKNNLELCKKMGMESEEIYTYILCSETDNLGVDDTK